MPAYLISYDLRSTTDDTDHKEDKTYEDIHQAIAALDPGHNRPLLSVWFITYEGTALDVYNKLRQATDPLDRVLVLQLGPVSEDLRAVTRNLSQQTEKWLTQHVGEIYFSKQVQFQPLIIK